MVARVNHDHIVVMGTRRSLPKYIKLFEDISDVHYALIEKNLIHYLPLKNPLRSNLLDIKLIYFLTFI